MDAKARPAPDGPVSTGEQGDDAGIDPTALAVLAATAGGALGSPGIEPDVAPSRPWSIAAAMEPVPPLAPPPARPGHGVALATASRQAGERRAGGASLAGVVVILVAVAVIVVLVLVVGR
jgi:hypothetical protein